MDPSGIIGETYEDIQSITKFEYIIVDSPERKADTPRQSLAHILYVDLVYLNTVNTGKLELKSNGKKHPVLR